MNGMVLRLRNKKTNPNLAYNNKQTCEQRKRNSKAYKKVKTKAYQVKQTKQKNQENQNQSFQARVCMHIHRPAYAGQLYVYAYFEPACTYKSMCMQTHLNPNPEIDKQKNKAEMKTLVPPAKHAQNMQENINLL